MTQTSKSNKPQKPFSTNSTAIILESISDGVFTVDAKWRITSFNRAAEEITGMKREETLGRKCSEVFRAGMCDGACALQRTLESGVPIVNKHTFIIDSKGRRIPISVSTALLKEENGRVIGGAETFRDMSLVEALRDELEGRFKIGDMVSRGESMRKIFAILPHVAESESTVLIQGETGTGKELLARAIHDLSPRRDKPFIALNCGALPDNLLESELFGYKAGAFTGAQKDKPGRFALAQGGSLFLDEIGEISQALQIRLLRVLQERVYDPLGAVRSVKADVRVITATNKTLSDEVKKGGFRQDLFYRINVVKIDLPPLRDRKEDIALLVDHFVKRFNRIQNKAVQGVSSDVLSLFMSHDFPGNIRELENLIEHAFVLCRQGMIERTHLPEEFTHILPQTANTKEINAIVKSVEAQTILETLKKNHFNRLKTAQELGIHKSTLFRKIKALGISTPEKDGRSK